MSQSSTTIFLLSKTLLKHKEIMIKESEVNHLLPQFKLVTGILVLVLLIIHIIFSFHQD